MNEDQDHLLQYDQTMLTKMGKVFGYVTLEQMQLRHLRIIKHDITYAIKQWQYGEVQSTQVPLVGLFRELVIKL